MEPGNVFRGVPHFMGCLAFSDYRSRGRAGGFDGGSGGPHVVFFDSPQLRGAFGRISADATGSSGRRFVRGAGRLSGGIPPNHTVVAAHGCGAGCNACIFCGELGGESLVAEGDAAADFSNLISNGADAEIYILMFPFGFVSV